MRKEDQYLTTFVCHLGVYEYTVATMGLRYSGCTFQKAINYLLMHHLLYSFSYVDDTSVYDKDFDNHLVQWFSNFLKFFALRFHRNFFDGSRTLLKFII